MPGRPPRVGWGLLLPGTAVLAPQDGAGTGAGGGQFSLPRVLEGKKPSQKQGRCYSM